MRTKQCHVARSEKHRYPPGRFSWILRHSLYTSCLPRCTAYTCSRLRFTRCFCVQWRPPARRLSAWLCKSRWSRGSHLRVLTRTYVRRCIVHVSMYNGLSICYCKREKAWRNGTLSSARRLNTRTQADDAGGLNSVTRTQITMDLYFSLSFSRALVIYSQPWHVCFVCSRVPVKYFTGRNERNEYLIA